MAAKMYGSYVVFKKEPDTENGKIEYVKEAVNRLLDKMKSWPVPDLNTLELFVKEDVSIFGGLDWYEEEKEGYTPNMPTWTMTVAIKYTEKENKDERKAEST